MGKYKLYIGFELIGEFSLEEILAKIHNHVYLNDMNKNHATDIRIQRID